MPPALTCINPVVSKMMVSFMTNTILARKQLFFLIVSLSLPKAELVTQRLGQKASQPPIAVFSILLCCLVD